MAEAFWWLIKVFGIVIVVALFVGLGALDQKRQESKQRAFETDCKLLMVANARYNNYRDFLCPDGLTYRVGR